MLMLDANHREKLPLQPLVYNYMYNCATFMHVYQRESQSCMTILVLRMASQIGDG